ncbi:MAG: hypothetical protein JJU26_10710 [Oceanicaulis sp.]|uniref:hypothetical protein n=1 Tax=Glycocaulis sp. TaxID=1969725 RepID=UPI0025C6D020|nr:hypothetical protein [Glycocaulis sp.]MCC5982176.1 hypothetical protein [Oceanicaulis sp.]MCH8520399.1 hypothetical protein [Glycocaulis sp.]
MPFILVAILFLATAAPARADLPGAREAYAAGEFERAETLASIDPSAEAQAFAAGAALALLMADRAENRRAVAGRLSAHARAALAADDSLAEAHLRLAAGIGFEGRYTGTFRAFMRRLPQQGKTHIERAMALDGADPWGPAMLGAWHFEVVRRGGGRALGASLENGMEAYGQAIANAPDDPVIAYFFAVALLASGEAAYLDAARAQLARSAELPPREGLDAALDTAISTRARTLLRALDDDPAHAARLAVAEMER